LTIKFTLDTEQIPEARIQTPESQLPISSITSAPHRILAARCVLQTCICPSIFNCQRTNNQVLVA